jgi:hypothetical protein
LNGEKYAAHMSPGLTAHTFIALLDIVAESAGAGKSRTAVFTACE